MPVKLKRPVTPGQRGMSYLTGETLSRQKPLKNLRTMPRRRSGRNNQGRLTVRHRGGGARRFYRIISFALPIGVEGKVEAVEYDPNRSARIMRLICSDGRPRYVLAPAGVRTGQTISSGAAAAISTGNRLPLKNIPLGSTVHAVEIEPGRGGQLIRSAGAGGQLLAKEGDYAQIKLPSGEVRRVRVACTASLGAVGNEQHQNVKQGKAGRQRHRGIRPTVRGVVMNAADHPHGGGDGGRHGVGGSKSHGTSPRTPWGQKTLGLKTRRRKSTSRYIVRSRHQSKRK